MLGGKLNVTHMTYIHLNAMRQMHMHPNLVITRDGWRDEKMPLVDDDESDDMGNNDESRVA